MHGQTSHDEDADAPRGSIPDYNNFLMYEESLDTLENLNDYCPGGFHPVHLRDELGPGKRYVILHKLGRGGFATVWLCRDTVGGQYVAVKILRADAPPEASPAIVALIDAAAAAQKSSPGARFIATPHDRFFIHGPNGAHECLVLPLLGPPISPDIWSDLSHPESTLRAMCHQASLALAHLHHSGICHGDFRPSNILVALAPIHHLSVDELMQLIGPPDTIEVEDLMEQHNYRPHDGDDGDDTDDIDDDNGNGDQVDRELASIEDGPEAMFALDQGAAAMDCGQEDVASGNNTAPERQGLVEDVEMRDFTSGCTPVSPAGVPRYLIPSANIGALISDYSLSEIRVVDFGQAFPVDQPVDVDALGIPTHYLPPDIIIATQTEPRDGRIPRIRPMLDVRAGRASDVWALGCTIFEMRLQEPLFYGGSHNSLLEDIVDALGMLPDRTWLCWSSRYEYFDRDGRTNRPRAPYTIEDRVICPLEGDGGVITMPSHDQALFAKLLRRLLTYDSAARPTAEDIVRDPWLTVSDAGQPTAPFCPTTASDPGSPNRNLALDSPEFSGHIALREST
ncbi:DNA polymerase epsilon subunit C [Purpureocillium lavendulum]|uniref:EKC/KEOPS complex subunit BUD32 n=1 Tax=Purpureocillium lavendulum TaxID=1247861 RepID=A0AB34FY47_9HYPO|nr:DNA polymerase epsilon subunit C [Purpureocillium lavendulum]